MPSSISSGPKGKSIRRGSASDIAGYAYRIAPDFIIPVSLVAADLTGANSGKFVFAVPTNVVGAKFLGVQEIHSVVGTNTFRVKKIVAGVAGAAGTASDGTNHVDLTPTISLAASVNVMQEADPVSTNGENVLKPGDKVALASATGTTGLAGGLVLLRFVWL